MEIKPRLRGRSGTRPPHLVSAVVTPGWTGAGNGGADREIDASEAVTAIYQKHALGLTRLAFLMLGDRQTAEEWCRRLLRPYWPGAACPDPPMPSATYADIGLERLPIDTSPRQASSRPLSSHPPRRREATVLARERQRETMNALRRLPPRQREALVLRYFADLPEQETALAMGVSRGTVKSTTSRALAALARMLQEEEL